MMDFKAVIDPQIDRSGDRMVVSRAGLIIIQYNHQRSVFQKIVKEFYLFVHIVDENWRIPFSEGMLLVIELW